jgi:hypothetical protein
LFKDFKEELPVIKDYNKATDLASRYLHNEMERKELVSSMLEYLTKKYSASMNAGRLAGALI